MSGHISHAQREEKKRLRRQGLSARQSQAGKDALSGMICAKLISLPEYRRAHTVLWYLDCRSEVHTRETVARELATAKTLAIPFVAGEDLHLWALQDLEELAPGHFGILEPAPSARHDATRLVNPHRVDLVVVPGVAFDRVGNRIGSGFGFYDRLLTRMRPDTCLLAPCFESQIVDSIPAEPHDIRIHKVITEHHVYPDDLRTEGRE